MNERRLRFPVHLRSTLGFEGRERKWERAMQWHNIKRKQRRRVLELTTEEEDRRVLWSDLYKLIYWEKRRCHLKMFHPFLIHLFLFVCYLNLKSFFAKDLRQFKNKRHIFSKTQQVGIKQQDPSLPPQMHSSFHPLVTFLTGLGMEQQNTHIMPSATSFPRFLKICYMMCRIYFFVNKNAKKKKKMIKGKNQK